MTKPKRVSSHDANHYAPRDYLRDRCGGFEDTKIGLTIAYTANFRGWPVLLIDTSAYGGVLPDWYIECPETKLTRWLEVKTPEAYAAKDHSLRAGEKWLFIHSGNFSFIVDDEDVENVLHEITKTERS